MSAEHLSLSQIMVIELSQHVVFNMRPAILQLHARSRIEHMHPVRAVLLSRNLVAVNSVSSEPGVVSDQRTIFGTCYPRLFN